ncbi:MAG TPA: phosphopantetheine-binding protein, partial [Longimicrobiaceae bacterium]
LYRTGDRARWLADGTLEFMGRLDAQVKIRGFRVEPGEIEAVLRRHPSVRDCVVMPRRDRHGETRLAAWVAADDGAATPARLRAHLRAALPEHMVPASITLLLQLPLTPNGKVDREALPAPDAVAAESEYVAPETDDERAVAAIWREVLGRERVGVHDQFFALGGDSLLATRVVIRTRDVLGREVPLVALFDHPTVAGFARAAAESPARAAPGHGPASIPRRARARSPETRQP